MFTGGGGQSRTAKPFLAFGLSFSTLPTLGAFLRGDLWHRLMPQPCVCVSMARLWFEFTRTRSTADHSDTKAHSSPRVASFMNAEYLLVEFPIVPRPPSLELAGGTDTTVGCFKDAMNANRCPAACVCSCGTCACVVRLPHLNFKKLVIVRA